MIDPLSAPPIIFAFEERTVRTVVHDGAMWFVGRDVCECLGLTNHNERLGTLDDDERKGVSIAYPQGGAQTTVVVSEAGVYRLIFTSRKPEAERFKRWLAHDVLPTIRKTGAYQPDRSSELRPGDRVFAEAVAAVQEARLTFGLPEARAAWVRFGLPRLPHEQPESDTPPDAFRGLVQSFLADRTTSAHPDARSGATTLWRAFEAWCTARRADARSQKSFGRTLRLLGRRKRQIGGRLFYDGLQLVD